MALSYSKIKVELNNNTPNNLLNTFGNPTNNNILQGAVNLTRMFIRRKM